MPRSSQGAGHLYSDSTARGANLLLLHPPKPHFGLNHRGGATPQNRYNGANPCVLNAIPTRLSIQSRRCDSLFTRLKQRTRSPGAPSFQEKKMSRFIDLTGQTFGRLTVIERAPSNGSRDARWKCLCTCGTEKTICSLSLRNGDTKSCGCIRTEKRKDLSGLRFGHLTVLRLDKDKDSNKNWLCKCDCGKEKVIREGSLVSGATKSCGSCEFRRKAGRPKLGDEQIQETVNFIRNFIEENKWAPSLKEIGKGICISFGAASFRLRRLEQAGLIERKPGSRTLRLTDHN
jgi:hypothetical protein